jgi:hypothetical protein
MSYQELNKTIDSLRAKVAELKGTQLHAFYSSKIAKIEDATDQIFEEEAYIEEELIVDPYPTYLNFRVVVLPLVRKNLEEYLKRHIEEIIKSRGNLSYTDAFFQFLGIANTPNWAPAFDNNPIIDTYLQNIYTAHQSQLTEMSIERYAKIIALNIWADYIVRNNTGTQTPITRSEGVN